MALTGVAGCLYTDPINVAPEVFINTPMSDIWRGQPCTFSAFTKDPGDSVRLRWGRNTLCSSTAGMGWTSCNPCPGSDDYLKESFWPDPTVLQTDFTLSSQDTQAPTCIWAIGTDSHGAKTPAVPYPLNPKDHPPVAKITPVNPELVTGTDLLRRYSEIQLSPKYSTDADNDSLSFEWHLTPPPNSALDDTDLGPCKGAASGDTARCLLPDIDGYFVVQLIVRDGFEDPSVPLDTLATATKTLSVATDQLPCLKQVSPESPVTSYDPNMPFLSVNLVDDDGAPFGYAVAPPPSMDTLHFRWFTGPVGGPLVWLGDGYDLHDFYLNTDHSPGEKRVVRVEIRDRNTKQIDDTLRACGDQTDTCADVSSGRGVCNLRFTWTVLYLE